MYPRASIALNSLREYTKDVLVEVRYVDRIKTTAIKVETILSLFFQIRGNGG